MLNLGRLQIQELLKRHLQLNQVMEVRTSHHDSNINTLGNFMSLNLIHQHTLVIIVCIIKTFTYLRDLVNFRVFLTMILRSVSSLSNA